MIGYVWDKVANILYGEAFGRERQYKKVYRYLDKYCGQALLKESGEMINRRVRANKTIWIAWLQGMEYAPKVVKCCFQSVQNNKPADFDLVCITAENIKEYIKLPDFVEEKYERGIITRTHLSDIIRTELLYAYGGCWIDATVYCSGSVPDYMLNSRIFAFRWSLMDYCTLMISSWWLCAQKGENIIREIRSLLYCYWEHEQDIKNYFLYHIIFSKVVNQNDLNREVFNRIPYFNNSMPHVLYWNLSTEFNETQWDIIKHNSPVHKLSYRDKYLQGDVYNFYMALLEGKLV